MNLSYSISPDRRTLTVSAGKVARAELAELDGSHLQTDAAMWDAFDRMIANSELAWISPEECGDLTDAPILGIHDAERGSVAERWGFMDYAIRSPLQDLRDTGKAVFTAP